MGIKKYSVTLEEEVVDRAKKIYYGSGRKLSPLINDLLEEWCDDYEKSKEEEE